MSDANDLKKFIVSFLNAKGWTVRVNNSGQVKKGAYMIALGKAGEGDVIGRTDDGRYVHVEVKIGDDVLSAKQVEVLADIGASKYGVACVARSEEQFMEWWANRTAKYYTPL